MSEPMFWSGSFEGKRKALPVGVLLAAGVLLAGASFALAALSPPAAPPLDLAAFWSQFAIRLLWQGLIGVGLVGAFLLAAPMKTSRPGDKLLAVIGLGVVWLVAALPPPMLQYQAARGVQATVKTIAVQSRAAAIRDKNQLVADFDAIGLGDCFTPRFLGGDPDLSRVSGKLDQARRLFADYRGRWTSSQDAERAEVARLSTETVPALDARAAVERADARRFAPAEDAYFDAAAAAIAELRSHPGAWKSVGPTVVFTDGAVLEAFKQRIVEMARQRRAVGALEDSKIADPFSAASSIWNEGGV